MSLETLPGLSEQNLSLYTWFKSNPKKNNFLLYPRWRSGVPTVLLKHASVWHDVFVEDEGRHPGDGLLYFHDFLLGDKFLSGYYNRKNIKPGKIPVYSSLFNYWYSFSVEKGASLTTSSERFLAIILSRNPRLAVPLYEYRRQIDLKLFDQFIFRIFLGKELLIEDFVRDNEINKKVFNYKLYINNSLKDVCDAAEHWLWEAILGFPFPRLLGDWRNRLLNLWAGYTAEAVRRFVTLHLPSRRVIISPRELRQYLSNAESLYLETKSLLGCYSDALVGECRVPKMSSLRKMQRLHNAELTEELRKIKSRNEAVYKWPAALTNILLDNPLWYFPSTIAEIKLRGKQHGHCVGAYADRHFEPPCDNKVLLMFSALFSAEIYLCFHNDLVSKAAVIQVKGRYNIDAPGDISVHVKEIAEKMKKLTAEAFCPRV